MRNAFRCAEIQSVCFAPARRVYSLRAAEYTKANVRLEVAMAKSGKLRRRLEYLSYEKHALRRRTTALKDALDEVNSSLGQVKKKGGKH